MEHLKQFRGLFRLNKHRSRAKKMQLQRPESVPTNETETDDMDALFCNVSALPHAHSCRDFINSATSGCSTPPGLDEIEIVEEDDDLDEIPNFEVTFELKLPDLTSFSLTETCDSDCDVMDFIPDQNEDHSAWPIVPGLHLAGIVESPCSSSSPTSPQFLSASSSNLCSFPNTEYRHLVDDSNQTMGRGACSVVTRGIHLPSCKIVAFKKTPMTELIKLRQAQHECELAGKLGGRHVMTIMDFGRDVQDPLHFVMSMELMGAGDLHDFIIDNDGLDDEIVASVARQLCLGLGELENSQIIHSDLTARNILISREGILKISDFGLSCDVSETVDGFARRIGGSVSCLSPERRLNQPYSYSADIFSMGIILWQCLIGREPIGEEMLFPNHAQMCEDELRRRRRRVDDKCLDFVLACLRRDPRERPSASSLLSHEWIANASETLPNFDLKADKSLLKSSVITLIRYYEEQSFLFDDDSDDLHSNNSVYSDDDRVMNLACGTGFDVESTRNLIARGAGKHRLFCYRKH